MRTIAGCSHMEGKDPRGPWEQPPVIRTSERFGHVRTTDCYSHVQGSDPGVDVRATAHDMAHPGGHVRTTAEYSHMKESGMCEQPTVIRTCKGRTHGGCEQPPVIHTGPTQGDMCEQPLVART